ncbi:MAG: hypothetical protein KatS3mg102_0362 [Planctomycetota bacterium]|nr:MAG: hypothetical protein KatS3mg102_0362 [Planctomycetota bacterium]
MSDVLLIDLFVEDRAHEEFLVPLVERVAKEEQVKVKLRVRSARGGHGRAIAEFGTYQKLIQRGAFGEAPPELVVVAIDGNCTTFADKKKEIASATTQELQGRVVAACPDPHVERWYLADPDSFNDVVGHRPVVGEKKCTRGHYKQLLASAVRMAGHPFTLGGIEFARDLVEKMDWFRAGKQDTSLKAFLDDLRAHLRQLGAQRRTTQ